jgi:kynurenine formamidase
MALPLPYKGGDASPVRAVLFDHESIRKELFD